MKRKSRTDHELKGLPNSRDESLRDGEIRYSPRRAQTKGTGFCLKLTDIEAPERSPVFGIELSKTWGSVDMTNEARTSELSHFVDSTRAKRMSRITSLRSTGNLTRLRAIGCLPNTEPWRL